MKGVPRLRLAFLKLLLCAGFLVFATNCVSSNRSPACRLDLSWIGLLDLEHCSVTGDAHKVLYKYSSHATRHELEVIPTREAWDKFWRTMDDVDVWEWQENYNNPNVFDGLAWSLKIERGQRKARSGGRNGYPGFVNKEKMEPEPSLPFKEYQRAVEELIRRPIWHR